MLDGSSEFSHSLGRKQKLRTEWQSSNLEMSAAHLEITGKGVLKDA